MHDSYIARRRAMLRDQLAKLQERVLVLKANPARVAALRAAEIEQKHVLRELAELDAGERDAARA